MIYILILIFYLIIAFTFRRNKVLLLLLSLQLVSVSAIIIINSSEFSNVGLLYNLPICLLLTILLILPWQKYDLVSEIEIQDSKRVDNLTTILLILSAYVFFVLGTMAILVQTLITDINQYKYIDGSNEFYHKVFPFDIHFYYLARILYQYSFLLIPLFFYYLTLGKKRFYWPCLIFSLNIILYGLCFFSRWTIALYSLMFLFYMVLFRDIVPAKRFRKTKKVIYLGATLLLLFFVFVTISRFGSDNSAAKNYESRIPPDASVQDPSLYSVLDYLGQSNYYGLYILDRYTGETFGGEFFLSSIYELLSYFGLPYDTGTIRKKEAKLWQDADGAFTGYAAYTIYDWGYIGAFIQGILYVLIVRLKKKKITMNKLLLTASLVQMPICAIFYSQIAMVVSCFILHLPCILYLSNGNNRSNQVILKK